MYTPTHFSVKVQRYNHYTGRFDEVIELWYVNRHCQINLATNQMIDRFGVAGDILYAWREDENGELVEIK